MKNKNHDEKTMATANAKYLPVSTKDAREVTMFVKNKNTKTAINQLDMALKKKLAIPFRRFRRDRGHKPGIAAGAYPEKTIKAVKKVINSAIANAKQKGLNLDELVITKACANRAIPKEKKRGKFSHITITLKVKAEPKKKPKKVAESVATNGKKETPRELPKEETAEEIESKTIKAEPKKIEEATKTREEK